MSYVEIEVRAKSVDLAVEAAMVELGVDDREEVSVQVVSEPVKGFLGFGGEDAVVRVKKKPKRNRRNRKPKSRNRNGKQTKGGSPKPEKRNQQQGKRNQKPKAGSTDNRPKKDRSNRSESKVSDDRPNLSVEEQAEVTKDFLEGLVAAYGLEGDVTTKIDDDVIIADVAGDQTEALVGIRGSVRSAIHELTRTVLQRYSSDTARLRLDIAGYGERRRKALAIYAEQLIEQLMEEGGEIMLEPMSPADRKVIHDAASDHDAVTSYSEGEPPRRYVVLSRVSTEGESDGEEE